MLSGLAWHTDDNTLRAKFEEFGVVEEAVSIITRFMASPTVLTYSRSWLRTVIPVAVVASDSSAFRMRAKRTLQSTQ